MNQQLNVKDIVEVNGTKHIVIADSDEFVGVAEFGGHSEKSYFLLNMETFEIWDSAANPDWFLNDDVDGYYAVKVERQAEIVIKN